MDWFLYDNGLRHERVNGKLHLLRSDLAEYLSSERTFSLIYQSFSSRTLTIHRTAKWRGNLYSSLPLPPAQKHSDIHLQLCKEDENHVCLIAAQPITKLQLDVIYHHRELVFD